MKLRKLSALGLASALLVGTLGIGASSAVAEDTYGSVAGKVTLNGAPLSNAAVTLVGPDYAYGGSATTDANGNYSIDWAEAGTWTVEVNNYTFDPVTYDSEVGDHLRTYSGNTVRLPEAQQVTVTAGGSKKVDIKAVPGAAVKGKIVDAKGKPVKGAQVSVSNTKRSGSSWAETDASGNYHLKGLATGPVTIWATIGSGAKFRQGEGTAKAVQGKTVTAKTVKLKSQAMGTIKATVKGLKKNDTIWLYDTKNKYSYMIATASKSKVKINEKVTPGTYRIAVGGQNKASKAVTVKAKKSVKAGTLKAVKKRTKVSGKIKGSNGKKLGGATVSVIDSYGTRLAFVTTKKNGKYSVAGVVSGKYTVEASDPSLKNATTDARVTVKKGKNAKKNVKLSKAYKVTGTIKHAGKPVAEMNVYASSGWDATGTDGKFSISGLGKGKHSLSAHDTYVGGYLSANKVVTVKKKNVTWNPSVK